MRQVKAEQFKTDREYQAARKAERNADKARRSGRRGTGSWGIWNEKDGE